ncbi:MAG: hypothetical protein HQL76_10750 [Magnetococcales bacterium]|nr:hypothetical protein [Magnetococcales bacterium]
MIPLKDRQLVSQNQDSHLQDGSAAEQVGDDDWVLNLPEELDNQFWVNLSNFEENQKMPYITSVERIGMRKGEEKGRHDGKAEMLLELLQERFGLIPESVQKHVESAKLDDINVWARKIFKADSLQAVFH